MTIIGPKTLVGGIFALLASAFIIAALWQTYEANRIAVLGEPAIGTVESVNRVFTGGYRGDYTYIPVVRFEAADGAEHTFAARPGAKRENGYIAGQSVAVLYLADAPGEV